MKRILIVLALSALSFPVYAESPTNDKNSDSGKAFLNLPFKSVQTTGGSTCSVNFHDVTVENNIRNISVDIDSVTVLLIQSPEIYTTLDLHGAREYTYGWINAEKAVVVVRQKTDLDAWKKFLLKKKVERDEWRKYWLHPTRVLPSEFQSP